MRVRREELEEGKSDAALDLERQGAEGLELVEAASVIWHNRIICHIEMFFVTFVTCLIFVKFVQI